MKAIILIQLLAVVVCSFADTPIESVSVLSDGRQEHCVRGQEPPFSKPAQAILQKFGEDFKIFCYEIEPSHPSYLHDVRIPTDPLDSEVTGSFVAISQRGSQWIRTLCNRLIPGDEANRAPGQLVHINAGDKRNGDFICTRVSPDEQ